MRQGGVTMVELLVTIAVAALLMGLAVPGLSSFIVKNTLSGYTNDFMATLNYARSEAIRRGATVTVCKSNTGSDCVTGPPTTWTEGWIVFVNKNGAVDSVDDTGPLPHDEILRVQSTGLSTGYTLNANTPLKNYIAYGPDGSANVMGTFVVCHDPDGDGTGELVGSRSISLTRLRPRVGVDSDGNGIPEKTDGGTATDISSCTSP